MSFKCKGITVCSQVLRDHMMKTKLEEAGNEREINSGGCNTNYRKKVALICNLVNMSLFMDKLKENEKAKL